MLKPLFEINLDKKNRSVGFNIYLVILTRTKIMYCLKHERNDIEK